MAHQFLFASGEWIGEGRITFSTSQDHFRFYTKWIIDPMENDAIQARQQIEIEGGGEQTANQLVFYDVDQKGFHVQLSTLSGTMLGTGIQDQNTIAWEFRGNPDFEGFEVYELQENGDYMLHAEYTSNRQFRTIVDGRIWKKANKGP